MVLYPLQSLNLGWFVLPQLQANDLCTVSKSEKLLQLQRNLEVIQCKHANYQLQ
ncbi:hypothetical protein SLEP1_g51536 [Rubroshorea leprosula]|uniref:Uncharacterized protein n=1 Tax=Rubroshorea leprosula TaxID=152421 RepID=A0AAV5M610_9ROSI|nr:hypothetical protein SLEP1_g51536 [Rubroshorea leprosula]